MKLPIYLDYCATTPLDPRVRDRMIAWLQDPQAFANPASITHKYGRMVRDEVAEARSHIAAVLNTIPESIIFTSGATASNNFALIGAAKANQNQGRHIITVQTEHKAVLAPCAALEKEGFKVTYLKPDYDGLLNIEQIEKAITPQTILISIMAVNNEIGVIQDIQNIGALLQEKNILFHVDAAQALGKIPIDLSKWPVDLVSFSGHKIYAPKGIGILYRNSNTQPKLTPIIYGGDQEQAISPGTLAPLQIIALAEAIKIIGDELPEEITRITLLRDRLWQGIQNLPGIQLHGSFKQRVPHNLNISFANLDAQTLLLNLAELAFSLGSACLSGSNEASHVLRAIGVAENRASNAMRICLGRFTTEAEIDFTIEKISALLKSY